MYFANGSECCIVSIGSYEDAVSYDKKSFLSAIDALDAVDDVTLLALPESVLLGEGCYSVQQAVLAHCTRRMNHFTILDVREDPEEGGALLHWWHPPDKEGWRKGR